MVLPASLWLAEVNVQGSKSDIWNVLFGYLIIFLLSCFQLY